MLGIRGLRALTHTRTRTNTRVHTHIITPYYHTSSYHFHHTTNAVASFTNLIDSSYHSFCYNRIRTSGNISLYLLFCNGVVIYIQ